MDNFLKRQFRIHPDSFRWFVNSDMRRVSAVALLFLYLSVNTDFHEVIRLPILFEHFHEHKQVNREVSFVEFIVFHYFSGDVKDADYNRDQQLPFKYTHCGLIFLFIAITTGNISMTLQPTEAVIQKVAMYTPPFISSLTPSTIWQPPRD